MHPLSHREHRWTPHERPYRLRWCPAVWILKWFPAGSLSTLAIDSNPRSSSETMKSQWNCCDFRRISWKCSQQRCWLPPQKGFCPWDPPSKNSSLSIRNYIKQQTSLEFLSKAEPILSDCFYGLCRPPSLYLISIIFIMAE